jgi:hypothetical protein
MSDGYRWSGCLRKGEVLARVSQPRRKVNELDLQVMDCGHHNKGIAEEVEPEGEDCKECS